MANDIEEVKRRVDVVDLIGSYVTLKKAGKDYKALCPFHKEKTPSFFVSPEKQIYKCFGCGKGGDVFDFVMENEGLEFGDALKLLADRAGVTLTPRAKIDREAPGLTSRLYAINRFAALFYHKILLEHRAGKDAREYLASRSLKNETIKKFWIGFAPAQNPLAVFLMKKGFSTSEVEKAGRPDRFAKRIIFPVFDVVGNVVGFSGRILDTNDQPKYINTPETDIFHKGRLLYGLFQARKSMKDEDKTIVVEGQMDVVMSHQAGVAHTVATSGTSLTDDHLHMLFRYSPNLYLAFDTDQAGLRAAERAIMMALAQGFTVRLIPLQEKDPADLVKADKEHWIGAIGKSKEAMSYIIDRSVSTHPQATADHKKSIAKEVLPYLAALGDPIEQESWVQSLARKLGVSEKTIYLALSKVREPKTVRLEEAAPARTKTSLTPAETLVALVLAYPAQADRVVKELNGEALELPTLITLFRVIKKGWQEIKKEPRRARDIVAKSLPPELVKQVDFLLFSIGREFTDEREAGTVLIQLLNRMSTQKNEELKRDFATKIAEAEASGNRGNVKKLMQEFQALISK